MVMITIFAIYNYIRKEPRESVGLFSGLGSPAGLVDRGQRGTEPAAELVQGLQLLMEVLEHLLVAVDSALVAGVALGDHPPVLSELGLHRLDVAGDAVDAHHQGGGDGLRGELAEALDQVGAVLELLGERQHGVDLGVVPGRGAEAFDGVVDALGDPLAAGVAEVVHDQDQEDQDQDRHDGDDGQDGVGGVHEDLSLFGCSRGFPEICISVSEVILYVNSYLHYFHNSLRLQN